MIFADSKNNELEINGSLAQLVAELAGIVKAVAETFDISEDKMRRILNNDNFWKAVTLGEKE
ncbi:hypothetical protein HMPREF9309_01638 [Campylobacter ureolyticus ACS-301-V-Sch3b]|uniref:Uncharacterized protein n=1 Tax=Campylobacter ureolyticus ACS-301-V-Sch3b TaxID=883165 RepID=S3X8Z8_9BACT|nr:hypothetical protein [Campylobacter ureolyticus]EPH07329.1 hypothetical protein HMPREF9309_01638 [Campylobacter ureolyticus ACS-301-V-Sch3b]MCZ6175080.1 hypothetical protein [Campylobacter ureolyticus]